MIAYARHLWQERGHLTALFIAILVASSPAAQAAPPAQGLPETALILFGAHWCAPCAAELHDLPALTNAVIALQRSPAPQIVLAWLDRPPTGPAVTRDPRRIVVLGPAHAQNLADPLQASARGLPFSVMTDAHGRVCAMHRGALKIEDVAALSAACQNTP